MPKYFHMDDINFKPVDREIKLDPDKAMVCKLDPEGKIDFVNDYFVEITGYEVYEIVGKNIEDLKKADLPMTIFNLVMEHLTNQKNLHIIVKDQAKDGRYYWYITDFNAKLDKKGNTISITSNRTAAPRSIIPEFDELYQKILKIEQHSSLETAKIFFEGFLEEKGMSFNDYTVNQIKSYNVPQDFSKAQPRKTAKTKPNKSLLIKLFGK